MPKKDKPKTNVQEWACKSVNIQYGCENNCTYCYAKKMAKRFNRVPAAGWDHPILKVWRDFTDFKLPQDTQVMFPSTHDITPTNVDACIKIIGMLIGLGNKILIVSKPRLECIKKILDMKFREDRIEFRFTIGTYWDDIRRMYEPQAPEINERIKCINYAIEHGVTVSISCEPLLERDDNGNVVIINHLLECKNIKEIWIGSMQYCANAPMLDYQAIYTNYKDNPKIKFKSSFMRHLQGVN